MDPNFTKDQRFPRVTSERERDQKVIIDGIDFSDVVFDPTPENTGFMFLLSLRIQLFIAACLIEPYKGRLNNAIGDIGKVFNRDIGNLIGQKIKQKIKEVPGYPKPTGGLPEYINLDDSEYTKDDENIFKNLPDFDELFKDAPDFNELLKDIPDFAP